MGWVKILGYAQYSVPCRHRVAGVMDSLCGVHRLAMHQPPESFGRVMARMPVAAYFVIPFETLWTQARAGTLHPGESAPDFSLGVLDKSETVQLSSFRGKEPVVLVFGSYT